MRICDEDIVAAFVKVSTPNQWESKRVVWFDFLDGTAPEAAPAMKPLFTIYGHHRDGRTKPPRPPCLILRPAAWP